MLLLIITGICFFRESTRLPRITFYGIPAQEATALQAAIGDGATYATFGTDTSLYYQLRHQKKPDILITTSGEKLTNALEQASKAAAYNADVLNGMTSSVRSSAKLQDEKVRALPLLSSHFEIDINTDMLRQTNTQTIATWEEIERFASVAKEQLGTTIAFAGKDGATTLDTLGALAEAFGGKKNYSAAVHLISDAASHAQERGSMFNGDDLAHKLAAEGDAPLYDAVQLLKKWYKSGLLNPEVFAFDTQTLSAYMAANMISVAFMSLDDHRALEVSVIKPYSSIYFPSNYPASTRSFTAPIIYAVPFSKNKKARALAEHLITTDAQENLSRATGLAPVLAQCRTPDRQADDARFWVAATNAPLAGLSKEVSLSDAQLNELGVALGTLIRFGN